MKMPLCGWKVDAFEIVADPEKMTGALREVGDSLGIDPSNLATWKTSPAQLRKKERPLGNALVRFVNR